MGPGCGCLYSISRGSRWPLSSQAVLPSLLPAGLLGSASGAAAGQGQCCHLNTPGLIPPHQTLLAALWGPPGVTTAFKVPRNHWLRYLQGQGGKGKEALEGGEHPRAQHQILERRRAGAGHWSLWLFLGDGIGDTWHQGRQNPAEAMSLCPCTL